MSLTTSSSEAVKAAGLPRGSPAAEYHLQLKRLDCGLMCYWHCSKPKLKTLVRDRRFQGANSKPLIRRDVTLSDPGKAGLIAILERADTRPKFGRSMELPPELRNHVYDYYMTPFTDSMLHAPTMPPLARLSKQLRHEVLPIFFSQCSFDTHFILTAKSVAADEYIQWKRINPPLGKLALERRTVQFYIAIPGSILKEVRRLRICVLNSDVIRYQNASPSGAVPTWTVPIPKVGSEIELIATRLALPFPTTSRRQLQGSAVTEGIAEVLEPMMDKERGRFRSFGMEQVYELRKMVGGRWSEEDGRRKDVRRRGWALTSVTPMCDYPWMERYRHCRSRST